MLTIASVVWYPMAASGQSTSPRRATAPATGLLTNPVLDRIHAAHSVSCGVVKEEEDYSRSEDHGNRAAFDIDLCKAVAIATLGRGATFIVKSYPDEPFAVRALRSGEVDLIATASLDAQTGAQGVVFSSPVLLDGQSMLFPNNPGVHSAADLAGKKICFLTGSAAELGLHSYAQAHGLTFAWYPFSEAGEMEAAFFTGNCDAVSSDLTSLANIRGIERTRRDKFTILAQTFRDDPLAIASPAGDRAFAAIVYWTVQLLFNAEKLGVTKANVRVLDENATSEIRQLLGQRFGVSQVLQLGPHWGAEVLEATGNYGELFERDLGTQSPAQLSRGDNRLTGQGGALYPVPLRDR